MVHVLTVSMYFYITDCTPDPCVHGTCTNSINGFTCSCNIGYTGHNCDQGIKIQFYRNFISFHFKYFIDKSIGLDNRLCLYKSSPTTRWNNLNTIYIRHRSIYPSCILYTGILTYYSFHTR